MAEAAASAEKPRAPSPKVAAPTNPPSESEIDSPNRLTLALLLMIFGVALSAWGAARFACNMHPPMSRPAPKLTTDRLITTPKDGALEFVQRWRSADYSGAVETSAGDLLAEMTKAKAACDARANDCAREREAAAGRLTSAVVLKQDGFRGETRVTTLLKGAKETYLVTVAREGALWKATSAKKE